MNAKAKRKVCNDNVSKLTCKSTFEIIFSKRSFRNSIFASVLLYLCLIVYTLLRKFENLIVQNKSVNAILITIILIFPLLLIFSFFYKIRFANKKLGNYASLVFYLLSPLYMLIVSEILNRVFVASIRPIIFIGGYFLILFLYLCFYAIIGNFKYSAITANTLVFLLSLANHYIFKFRGTPFIPTDFLATRTGLNVALAYDFSPDFQILASVFMFSLITVICVKTDFPKFKLNINIIARTTTAVFSAIVAIIIFCTDALAHFNIVPTFFQQSVSCSEQGFLLNFVSNIKYMCVSTPENYNSKEIKNDINNIYVDIDKNTNFSSPNIICIMNEAFSDLSVFDEFETNEAYMPFLDSLTKDTIKGNLYVSVAGGGTANTEFEFLTGHSMKFLPSGSFPYVSYIKTPMASMVSTLKAQGYATNTFHPYYASGWNRTKAYGCFGFERFISIDNMFNSKMIEFIKLNEFNSSALQKYVESNYANDTDMFKRNYISDSYNFRQVIKDFENRDSSKPYFMFNVTMQNHGGYTIAAENLEEDIILTSLSGNYKDVNRYLSLIKHTDTAFKELLEYFSNVDEPTVICMFGDHQPALDNNFFDELTTTNYSSYTEFQKIQNRFCTPFCIWANYDIEEQFIDKLSANYLSSLVMKTANVEMPLYNKYLLRLSEILPVINVAGYCDSMGNYYGWQDDSPYKDLLNNYEKIQYNNLFDQENVDKEVFYINGYVPEATDLTN